MLTLISRMHARGFKSGVKSTLRSCVCRKSPFLVVFEARLSARTIEIEADFSHDARQTFQSMADQFKFDDRSMLIRFQFQSPSPPPRPPSLYFSRVIRATCAQQRASSGAERASLSSEKRTLSVIVNIFLLLSFSHLLFTTDEWKSMSLHLNNS
jgi:hypothetical protein